MTRNLTLIVLIAGLAVGVLAAGAHPRAARQEDKPDTSRTISATGRATVFAQPDIVIMEIHVNGDGDEVGTAMAALNERVNDVATTLAVLGVGAADIHTSHFYMCIYRDYDERRGTWKDTYHYNAHSTLVVTLRDPGRLTEAIDQAMKAGAADVTGILFGLSDTAPLEAEARAQALADVRTQAQRLAEAAGITLGELVSIRESTYSHAWLDSLDFADAPPSASVTADETLVAVRVQVIATYTFK
jgi:hypothetical protein